MKVLEQKKCDSVVESNILNEDIDAVSFTTHTTVPRNCFEANRNVVKSPCDMQRKLVDYIRHLNLERENREVSQKKISVLREKMIRGFILSGNFISSLTCDFIF